MLPSTKQWGALACLGLAGLILSERSNAQGQADAPPFREYRVASPVKRHFMTIAPVWLPPITMDRGKSPSGPHVIHLECDVHATRNNPNGFAFGEWIPYLTVTWKLEPLSKADGARQEGIEGRFHAMVARDGPHYGATIRMPGKGRYKLTCSLRPPTENGFGRHTDPVTGVDPWWEPFEVEFLWDFPGHP